MEYEVRSELPDHASEYDERCIPLTRVGINQLRYPIGVLDRQGQTQTTVADFGVFVALPKHQRGTHMSRLVEAVHLHKSDMTIRRLPNILKVLQRKLDAPAVELRLQFPYFIEKKAPISQIPSLMDYNVCFTATLTEEKFDFLLEVEIPVKSLCPCSKGISDRGAHNQRSFIRASIRSNQFVWIEDVVSAIESQASAPLFAMLKREDEKFITELAYDNPKFAEDLARDSLLALRELGGVRDIRIIVENHESIHNHQAYAEVAWTAVPAETQDVSSTVLPSLPSETQADFGSWLKLMRLDRKMSQSELARTLGLTASYLSRIESGDRAVSLDVLGKLAEIFGCSEAELHLRAGRLPPEFHSLAMTDPQSLLRRLAR